MTQGRLTKKVSRGSFLDAELRMTQVESGSAFGVIMFMPILLSFAS